MAAGEEKPVTTKEELIAALEQSRRSVATDLPALGHALNPVERVKKSLTRHPVLWMVGSAAAGLAGTRLLSASRHRPGHDKIPKSVKFSLAPLLGFLLKSAIAAAQPAATRAVKNRVSKLLDNTGS